MPPVAACPGTGTDFEAQLTAVTCREETLLQMAREVQPVYYRVFAAAPDEARKYKFRWRSAHVACGRLIMQPIRQAECIHVALSSLMQELRPVVAGAAEDTPEEAYRKAHRIQSERLLRAERARAACITAAAEVVDDGVSTARDIAVVVAGQCRRDASRVALQMVMRDELESPFMALSLQALDTQAAYEATLTEPDSLIADILRVRRDKREQATLPLGAQSPKAR